MNGHEMITLSRDTEAVEIPYGTKTTLPKGSQVMIEQTLGGSFTVLTDRGAMVRIAGADADSLGLEPPPAPGDPSKPPENEKEVEDLAWEQLKTCFDPEIPVNIVDLGLVYACQASRLEGKDGFRVDVRMTLTAPGCGMGDVLKMDAEEKLRLIPGVEECEVEMVVDPPWDPSLMSDAARLQLNMF